MPKLDSTHLSRRIAEQIDKLETGETLIIRDVKALLSKEALGQVEAKWRQQKLLRKGRRPSDENEKAELGWATKRQLYLAALKSEMILAKANAGAAWKKKVQSANVRQIRIFFDALNQAERDGKTGQAARTFANIELTRAGLRRLDGIERNYTSRRSREVHEMEAELLEQLKTDEEREQEKLMEQQNVVDKKLRKGGRKKKIT